MKVYKAVLRTGTVHISLPELQQIPLEQNTFRIQQLIEATKTAAPGRISEY